ncbi:hypothetical protein OVN18_02585 [Microcella daejeonensis]|uniref:Uncharacterized protein n=1 Tax=Microcella daejeonensis TaxID=2994971 RepID=A0A9E8MLW5_9MICO|nr:hypothetical protein [Microcella daejeonensis]WAB81926.1 hypothetical protein OVN18_02585 [Microcella daejeonensis]
MDGVAVPRPAAAQGASSISVARLRSLLLWAFALAVVGALLSVLWPTDRAAAAERHPAGIGSLLGDVGDGLTSVVDSTTDVVDATVTGTVAVVDAAAPVAAPITQVVVEQVAAPLTAVVDTTADSAVGAVIGTTAPVVEAVDEVVDGVIDVVPGLPEAPGVGAPAPVPTAPDLGPEPGLAPPAAGSETPASEVVDTVPFPFSSIVGATGVAIAPEPTVPSDTSTVVTGSAALAAATASSASIVRGGGSDPAARGPLLGEPMAAPAATASANAPAAGLGAATLDGAADLRLDSSRTAPPRDDRLPAGPCSYSTPSPD